MWRPQTIEEFEAAISDGVLDERHDFDAKRQLPNSGKELAKDIAAMTTDGGSLVYGVSEDSDGRPRVLTPIELAGSAERIDQVASHSITGSPRIEFVRLRLMDDQARGYLIVLIPPSPEAPHQVTVGNDRRFYGRCDTGNRRLSEEEIARLYSRRESQKLDREQLLAECIAQSPFGPPVQGKQAFLQAFARPAVPDDELWEKAVGTAGGEQALVQDLQSAVRTALASVQWGGSHLGSDYQRWARRGADKWSLESSLHSSGDNGAGETVRADVAMDGRAYLFYGHAAELARRHPNGNELLVAYETGIALNLAEFLVCVGRLYEIGGLYGFVDIGIAVTGLRGAVSSHRIGQPAPSFSMTVYADEAALRTLRCDVRDLSTDPRLLVRRLTGRLMRALYGADLDPLDSD